MITITVDGVRLGMIHKVEITPDWVYVYRAEPLTGDWVEEVDVNCYRFPHSFVESDINITSFTTGGDVEDILEDFLYEEPEEDED